MRYEITEHDDHEVEVRVHETGEPTPRLLASLQDCQHGRCDFPTDEDERLEDMASTRTRAN